VRRVLERQREARAPLSAGAEEQPAGIVGHSPAMIEVYKTIARVAPGPSTVLFLGDNQLTGGAPSGWNVPRFVPPRPTGRSASGAPGPPRAPPAPFRFGAAGAAR
jgi:hypothetical protein